MRIFVISDTHGFHDKVKIPEEIDMVIHCGDATNSRDKYVNSNEMHDFLYWYEQVNAKYKIYIPGNHDSSIEKGIFLDHHFKDRGIDLLIHQAINIEGINIFGSPFTPTYGDWSYMKDRAKLNEWWQDISENIDILVTHGPPKTILDLSYSPLNQLEFCGDRSLLNHVIRVNPKYHCFGHIHDFQDILNYGTRTIADCNTTFINTAMVEDGKFDKGLIHTGHIIEI